ncbi:MAG: hypothetical protein ACI3VJ_06220 [Hominicoprocola sp.]
MDEKKPQDPFEVLRLFAVFMSKNVFFLCCCSALTAQKRKIDTKKRIGSFCCNKKRFVTIQLQVPQSYLQTLRVVV